MGVNIEIVRNMQEALQKGDQKAAAFWEAQKRAIESAEESGLVHQLTHAGEIQPPKIDLRQPTLDLLHHIKEPPAKMRTELEDKGFWFSGIERQSYLEVVIKNHYRQSLYDVNPEKTIRAVKTINPLVDYVPPVATSVGFLTDSRDFYRSTGMSLDFQLWQTEQFSKSYETDYPGFKAVMLPATFYLQAELDHVNNKSKYGYGFLPSATRTIDVVSESLGVVLAQQFSPLITAESKYIYLGGNIYNTFGNHRISLFYQATPGLVYVGEDFEGKK